MVLLGDMTIVTNNYCEVGVRLKKDHVIGRVKEKKMYIIFKRQVLLIIIVTVYQQDNEMVL